MIRRFLCFTLSLIMSLSAFVFIAAPKSAVSAAEQAPAAMAAPVAAALPADGAMLPYMNTNLTFEERAADLVSRMTLDEKQAQLVRLTPAIPRLGVGAYNYWMEAVHGVARQGAATSFPTCLGMASSWDTDLIRRIGGAISDEARGKMDENPNGRGLSYWSPTMNLARDPRWGRNEESYGEDPTLTAATAGAYVLGMQGDDPTYLKTISTIKHYAANNNETNREMDSSDMDIRTLREYYTATFRDIVEKDRAGSVMSAYNAVNGVPCPANTYLLDTLLRKSWGFDGYVVSDCGAVPDIWSKHYWVPDGWNRVVTPAEGVAFAIKAGTDLECGSAYSDQAENAIGLGALSENDVDQALTRLFTERMKTGEFDQNVPYKSISKNVIESPANLALSLQASLQAPVLLQNKDNLLPLDLNSVSKLVVIGPLYDHVELGDYSGSPTTTYSLKAGIDKYISDNGFSGKVNVSYYQGIPNDVQRYVLNLKWFMVNGVQVNANDCATLLGGTKDTANGNLASVDEDAYAIYHNVDLTDLSTIAVNASTYGGASGGTTYNAMVEVHVGTQYGPLLATIPVNRTGGWGAYVTTQVSAGNLGYTGPQDVCLVFRTNMEDVIDQNAIAAARGADAVIVFAGTTWSGYDNAFRACHEGSDRTSLELPKGQALLAERVAEANPKTAVVIQSVGFHNVDKFVDKADSLIYTCYNGQFQGLAMADLLFGAANPSGRLPFTWMADERDLPYIKDYAIRPEAGTKGRTYQFFTGDVRYPFGFGLSYSNFRITNAGIDKTSVTASDTLTVTADVTNTGDMRGAQIVQAYISAPGAGNGDMPVKQLKGFARVDLAPGETKPVQIKISMDDVWFFDQVNNKRVVIPGNYTIEVGASSGDTGAWRGSFTVTQGITPELRYVTVRGDKVSARTGETVKYDLTAAMNDETFFDLSDPAASVSFSSSDPAVATVDSNGVATALSEGTTMITATVSINGAAAVSGSYPLAVNNIICLNGIRLNGIELQGFDQKKYYYEVPVPDGLTVAPFVTAAADQGITVTVYQAPSVPGSAVINLVRGIESAAYTVYFGYAPKPDDFTTGKLGTQWTIVREDSSHYSLGQNGLTITTQRGDLRSSHDNHNMFVQPGTGDWTATTSITFDRLPYASFQQVALVAYQDDSNYVKCDLESNGSIIQMQLGSEASGSYSGTYAQLPQSFSVLNLKLERSGSKYIGYYAIDGGDYVQVSSTYIDLRNVQVGIAAHNAGTDAAINATFKNFMVDTNSSYPYGVDEIKSVDILVNSLVEGFAANIPVKVTTADNLQGAAVTVTLTGNGTVWGTASADADGNAIIHVTDPLPAGEYAVTASIPSMNAEMSRGISVLPMGGLWQTTYGCAANGNLLITFDGRVDVSNAAAAVDGDAVSCAPANRNILEIGVPSTMTGRIVISGVKTEMFPSQSFTVNIVKERSKIMMPDKIYAPSLAICNRSNLQTYANCAFGNAIGNMHLQNPNAWCEWDNVDGGQGGDYRLGVNYGVDANGGQFMVNVNGVDVGAVTFYATGGYGNYFGEAAIVVTLKPGPNNSIRFTNIRNGGNFAYISISNLPDNVYDASKAACGNGASVQANGNALFRYVIGGVTNANAWCEWSGVEGGGGGNSELGVNYSSTSSQSGVFSVTVNGNTVGNITLGNTAGASSWNANTFGGFAAINVPLNPGAVNTIRLTRVSGDSSIAYISVSKVPGAPYLAQAASFGSGANIQANTNAVGGWTIGNTQNAGAWCQWDNVDGGQGGLFGLNVSYAIDANGGQFTLNVNDGEYLGVITFFPTGGYNSFIGRAMATIPLNPGKTNSIRLTHIRNAGNIAYISLTDLTTGAAEVASRPFNLPVSLNAAFSVTDDSGLHYADTGRTGIASALDLFTTPAGGGETYYYLFGDAKSTEDVYYDGADGSPVGSYFGGSLVRGAYATTLFEALDKIGAVLIDSGDRTIPVPLPASGSPSVLKVIRVENGVNMLVFSHTFGLLGPCNFSAAFGSGISAVIENNTDASVSGHAITAVYSKSGALAAVESKDFDTPGQYVSTVNFDIDLSQFPSDTYTYKVFFWDKDFMPLTAAITP